MDHIATTAERNGGGRKKSSRFRGSVSAISPTLLFVLFGVLTAAIAAIRAFQLLYLFEPDTGFFFFEKANSVAVPLLYAVCGIGCLLCCVLSYLSAGIPEGVPPQGKKPLFAVSAVIYAASLIVTAWGRYSASAGFDGIRSGISANVMFEKYQQIPRIVEIGCTLLAAIYIIAVAVSFLLGKTVYKSVKAMSVFPIGFYVFRLMGRFVRAQSFLSVTELFWEIAAAVLMMLFFLEFARIMAEADGKDKLNFAFGLGLSGASISLMLFLSRLAVRIIAGDAYLSDSAGVEFCDLGAALFAVAFLGSTVYGTGAAETAEKTTGEPTPVNRRNIAACIILSFVTFGVYQIYWLYLLVKNTRILKKDTSDCTGEMLCLLFVPFYSLYWWYTRGKTVQDGFGAYGLSAAGSEIAYLVLGLFGLQIISMAIMQNDFNSLPDGSGSGDDPSGLQRGMKTHKKDLVLELPTTGEPEQAQEADGASAADGDGAIQTK